MFTYQKPKEQKLLDDAFVELLYKEVIHSIIYDKVEDFKMLTSKVPFWQFDSLSPNFVETYINLSSYKFKEATINTDWMQEKINKEIKIFGNRVGYSIKESLLYQIIENKEYALYEQIHQNNKALTKEKFISLVIDIGGVNIEKHLNFFSTILKHIEYKDIFKSIYANQDYTLLGLRLSVFKQSLTALTKKLSHDDLKEMITNNLTHLAQKQAPYLNLDVIDLALEMDLLHLTEKHLLYIKSQTKASQHAIYEKALFNQNINQASKEAKKLKI